MRGIWRYPTIPVGIVLVILGLGNWIASHSKVVEYEQRARESVSVEDPAPMGAFSRLTPRTSATLLDRLQPHFGDYGVAAARRDFYAVVQSGGRLITIVGMLLVGLGLLQWWREHRLQRMPARPSATLGPPASAASQ
jgi:hypothetical protein